MNVKIFKPAKNAMQSGRAGSGTWVIEYDREMPRQPEPLMGWTSADDTLNQVRLKFKTAEEAVEFAQKKGWDYTLSDDHARKVKPRNYGDNFRYIPPAEGA